MDPRLQPLADVLVKILAREILGAQKPTGEVGFCLDVPLDKGQEHHDGNIITRTKSP